MSVHSASILPCPTQRECQFLVSAPAHYHFQRECRFQCQRQHTFQSSVSVSSQYQCQPPVQSSVSVSVSTLPNPAQVSASVSVSAPCLIRRQCQLSVSALSVSVNTPSNPASLSALGVTVSSRCHCQLSVSLSALCTIHRHCHPASSVMPQSSVQTVAALQYANFSNTLQRRLYGRGDESTAAALSVSRALRTTVPLICRQVSLHFTPPCEEAYTIGPPCWGGVGHDALSRYICSLLWSDFYMEFAAKMH